MKSKSNIDKLIQTTDENIEKIVKNDPDASLLSKDELKEFKRVKSVGEIDVKKVRKQMHLTQEQFAFFFGVKKRTIQEWEQKRKKPSMTSRNFLRVVQFAPKVVQEALQTYKK